MGAHYINVAPRYTPGSPASVGPDIAERVANDERENYDFVIAGHEGAERADQAKKRGLALVVFEMVEVGKGWWVHDWLTGEMHWWPFEATCPNCGRKKVRCERGVLSEHGCPFHRGQTNFVSYVGRLANEDERRSQARRFFKQPE